MICKNIKEIEFLDQIELTDDQIEETRTTYENNADKYVLNYERRPGALEEARLFTLDPFLREIENRNLKGKILFTGCGSGRDMEEAGSQGFPCVGIDTSLTIINIGKIMGITSPMMEMDMEKMDFPDNSFDGVFCETAIAHVKRKSISQLLLSFKKVLSPNGILLVTFRKGDGRVYLTVDKVGGRRFYVTMTRKRAEKYLLEAGFEIIGRSSHKVGDRPPYYNLLAINKK
jgi:ubiquinone/menaquinone biosynthesis C-methylase UbiE